MLSKKEQRLRRARQTRARIAKQGVPRLVVARSNLHVYANLISEDGNRVLVTVATTQMGLKGGKGATTTAAAEVGKLIAEKAKAAGVEKVAFDRSGYAYHGRVKALAEAAREAGLQF